MVISLIRLFLPSDRNVDYVGLICLGWASLQVVLTELVTKAGKYVGKGN
jgi:hypothetical protein